MGLPSMLYGATFVIEGACRKRYIVFAGRVAVGSDFTYVSLWEVRERGDVASCPFRKLHAQSIKLKVLLAYGAEKRGEEDITLEE